MKNLYQINKWLIIVNALLYITIYFGLIFQILLGTVQVIMAIIIAFNYSKLTVKTKRLFIIYSFATSIVLTLIFFTDYLNSTNYLIHWIIIPQMLAFFHLYITYLIYKSKAK